MRYVWLEERGNNYRIFRVELLHVNKTFRRNVAALRFHANNLYIVTEICGAQGQAPQVSVHNSARKRKLTLLLYQLGTST